MPAHPPVDTETGILIVLAIVVGLVAAGVGLYIALKTRAERKSGDRMTTEDEDKVIKHVSDIVALAKGFKVTLILRAESAGEADTILTKDAPEEVMAALERTFRPERLIYKHPANA